MARPPTDLDLLEEIYRRYYGDFTSFSKDKPNRDTKVYVPIDLAKLAEHFSVDNDIIFGRLYYHLEAKFGIKKDDGTRSPLFLLKENSADPSTRHQIQFPVLAAAIASLRESRNQYLIAMWIAGGSLLVSVVALCVSLVKSC